MTIPGICIAAWFAVALAVALGFVSREAGAVTVPSQFVVEDAAPGAGFNTPTGIAFFPSGRYLVAEKRGRVYSVFNGVKAPTPMISIESKVLDEHDRGFLGIAIDPNYAVNRFVYFMYTVDPDSNSLDDNDEAYGRIVRYTVSSTDSTIADPNSRVVLMGRNWREGPLVASPSHTIGSLRFGRDGSLLVSVGDGGQYSNMDKGGQDPNGFGATKTDPYEDIGAFRAQYIGSLCGKILRLNPATGQGYASNPFYDGNLASVQSRVWEYGLRNPFRFNVRPGTGSTDPNVGNPGVLYIGQVGWATWEKLMIGTSGGKNFGWPCYEGVGQQSQYWAATPTHHGCNTIPNPSAYTTAAAVWNHGDPNAGTPNFGFFGNCSIGGVFYTATSYPAQYRGQYFFADYGEDWIKVAVVDANNQITSVLPFATTADAPVDFAVNPVNGDVYYVSIGTSQVRRIRYTGAGGNASPIANANGTPTSGNVPLAVTFSSAGSSDPDNDPISYSWSFGDGQGSTAANPSHTYTVAGTYNAILTLDDGRGGVGRDTVVIFVSSPGATGFPTAPVLDAFNRANGAPGANWVDPAYGLAGVQIVSNALQHMCCYQAPVWSPTSFGADQEAFVTISTLSSGDPGHDLMLKIQGNSWNDPHIEVRYDDVVKKVKVATYTPAAGGWQDRGTPVSATLVSGDQLGARARPDGTVQLFKNGTLLGTNSVAGWQYAASGGRIGLTLDGTTGARFDNFGGGNTVLSGNSPPVATILTPADGSFYVAGDVIALSGTATDPDQASNTLTYLWEMDIHHNNHIHPNSVVLNGPTASYVAINHDDGTGVYEEIRLIVTDNGGLKDTTRINHYPEIDLMPSAITVSPAAPTTTDPIQYSFWLRNLGRMPAPYSRWRLRAGNVTLAERDTLVQARDSVQITVTVGPNLAAGTYTVRVKADTLAAVVETNESNNASSRALTVTPAAGGNNPPVAAANGLPTSGTAPLTVAFSSTGSSDPDGDPLGFAWAFGDNTNGTGPSPSHQYTTAGSYTAVLTVTDGRGGSATANVAITVNPAGGTGFPTTAVLDNFNRANGAVGPNWVDPAYGTAGIDIQGNALHHACCYQAPVWNPTSFGPDQEAYVTITKLATGDRGHDLMLKVQGNSWNNAHVEVRYDDVGKKVRVATYTPGGGDWLDRGTPATATFVNGDQLGARASADGTVQLFKNGVQIGTVSLAGWQYATAGGRIGLTLDGTTGAKFDNFGGGNASGAPPANRNPVAAASGNPTSGTAPLTVAFSSSGSSDPDGDPLGFAWAFGDGQNGTGASPSHQYASIGNYTAVLTVTDGRGGSATASVPISVTATANRPPVAAASGNPTSGTAPLTVAFSSTGSSDPDGDPLSFAWAFGDGQNGTGASPSHPYTSAGSYTAVLTVTDGRGGSATANVPITVNPAGGASFPTTAVLDNFNRANGAVGSNWVDPAYGLAGLDILSNTLHHACCYQAPVWNPTTFGADQEAYITITQLQPGEPGHDLMLKIQGNSWSAAHIEVRYDDIVKQVKVATYTPTQGGWQDRGAVSATLVSGDQLGARARADGTVQMFKNGVQVGQVTLTGWPFAATGGRIGLTLDGTTGARFDNFGGGNTVVAGPALVMGPGPEPAFYDRLELPAALSISGAYPNPARRQVSFAIGLPENARVELAVYDLQGRVVWTESRDQTAGHFNLFWSGQTPGGPAATGIYLARIAVNGRAYMRRFALMR